MKALLLLILAGIGLHGFSQQTAVLLKDPYPKEIFLHLDRAAWSLHEDRFLKQPPADTGHSQVLPGADFGAGNAPSSWKGIGWFSLWVKADTSWVGKKLAIQINHDGASEIFVDTRPVGGYGTLGYSAQEMTAIRAPKSLIPLWLNDTLPHLISVHYANFIGVFPEFLGFQLAIGDYERAHHKITTGNHRMNFMLMTVAAHFILAFLYLFLYICYPTQKLNIFYAVFVLMLGLTMLSIYFFYQTSFPQIQFLAVIACYVCKVGMIWAGSLMLYAVGYHQIPRNRLIVVTAVPCIYIILELIQVFVLHNSDWNDHFSLVFFLFTIDGFISVFHAIKRKLPHVWLIATSMAAISLVYFFAWSDVFGLWPWHLNTLRLLCMAIGNLIAPFCLSLYLALDFARTNYHLTAKLREVETLYVQNMQQEAEKLALIAGEAKRLEATVQERTAEIQQQANKLKEMDAAKSRFFTNITHEFKTPLTLIINPARELLSKSAAAFVQTNATLIHNNAQRLQQLINQLLDLSRLENGIIDMMPEPVELVQEIKEQLLLYKPLVLQKEIALLFSSDWSACEVLIDKDTLRKILHNLLSNAIKFTGEGQVEVCIQALPGSRGAGFHLVIKDTGKGIAPNKLPYIFERFYQADPEDTRNYEGSGIGLALVKELIVLMEGTIEVESKEGAYTMLSVSLPCPIVSATPCQSFFEIDFPVTAAAYESLPAANASLQPGKHLVLVIEDNKDLRDFLCLSLGTHYNVISAPDGKAGVDEAIEQIPDLIITDIMMPGADGYWVCGMLKTNEKTSHIPVIFLTAKSDTDSRIKGIERGADAYLGKPFHQQELVACIENLVTMRSVLQKKYSTGLLSPDTTTVLPSIEQKFINRIHAFIGEHLDDAQFGADQLAVLMNLSRSQLHRKLKGLLGKSAGELVRTARMEHAHHLLKSKAATVSETAYRVGFSTPSAFSTSFSRHFGYSPSDVSLHATK